ncbi:MAG: FkbM family methyltransferase [Bacteroidetes bacterium]|nr:FkbM family methyltransferase [Bacteroidota bacterium]
MGFTEKVRDKIKSGDLWNSVYKTIRNQFLLFRNNIRYHNALYFLDKERVVTKKFIDTLTPAPKNLIKYANYSLSPTHTFDQNSIVYSLGIFRDISFDLSISESTGCTVHLFDPTPATVEFMKKFSENKKLDYHPIGVWIQDEELTFYVGKEDTSSTLFDQDGVKKFVHFKAKCETIPTIMNRLGHQQIDVLKMDIEGAALPVCEHMLENKIYPKQIVGEFERPIKAPQKVKEFLKQMELFITSLQNVGYTVYSLHRKQAYYSVELLAVKER